MLGKFRNPIGRLKRTPVIEGFSQVNGSKHPGTVLKALPGSILVQRMGLSAHSQLEALRTLSDYPVGVGLPDRLSLLKQKGCGIV